MWYARNGQDFESLPVLKILADDFDPVGNDDSNHLMEGETIDIAVGVYSWCL